MRRHPIGNGIEPPFQFRNDREQSADGRGLLGDQRAGAGASEPVIVPKVARICLRLQGGVHQLLIGQPWMQCRDKPALNSISAIEKRHHGADGVGIADGAG